MATLSFEGETHGEIVMKVKRWLVSLEGGPEHLTASETIDQVSELTKDALRVIASSAPGPIAHSEIMKGLTSMGYKATDLSKQAVQAGLDTVEEVTGGSVLKRVSDARKTIRYEMNTAVANQILKALRG
jgi:hypothetical protein